MVGVVARHEFGLLRVVGFIALVGLEMVLHPNVLALLVVPHVGVAAVAVHVAEVARGAAVGEKNGHLVTDSGVSERKSQNMSGSGQFVAGLRFCVWMKSGNFMASRMKKTGVLLPTMS